MRKGFLMILLATLLLAGTAFANVDARGGDVNVLGFDGNTYSSTMAITFDLHDVNANATDVNIYIYYLPNRVGYDDADGNMARHLINNDPLGSNDYNASTMCDSPITATPQVCTYNWTLPTGLDGNYMIDINVYDITNSDDYNSLSSFFIMDSNACDTNYTLTTGSDLTFDANCTGAGSTATIYYTKSRQRSCGENYDTYTDDSVISSTFGEFMVCYYSVDSQGNTEGTQSLLFTADSEAYDIAVLAELMLAALIIFAIAAAFIILKSDLSAATMLPLVIGAVIIVLAIFIFATIL